MSDEPAARFRDFYRLLSDAEIEFILIGGAAAALLGLARLTLDVDIVYRRAEANMRKIVDAFAPLKPYLRGAPAGLPFELDLRTMRNGLNFTLQTTWGGIDLFGEVVGGGNYEQLLPFSDEKKIYGIRLRCVNLEKLIHLKRAAGRPKDNEMIAQLEALRQEKRKLGPEAL